MKPKLIFETTRFQEILDNEIDYYLYEYDAQSEAEIEELAYETAQQTFQDEIDYFIEKAPDEPFYLLDGYAGLWNGNHPYPVQRAGYPSEIVSKLSRHDDLKLELYKLGKGYMIKAWADHHDGTNYYEFYTLSALTKKEIMEIFGEKLDLKNSMTRDEMEDEIEEYFVYNQTL